MIHIQNVTKAFGDRYILNKVNYHFPTGQRIALVGHNGAGKTTFLNILCGLDEADTGALTAPRDFTLAYLPQSPNPTPESTLLDECLAGAKELNDLQRQMNDALAAMEHNYSDALYETYEKVAHEFERKGGYELEANAKGILVGLGFQTEQFAMSPLDLSGGWRMRLELAKILIQNPDFLVLDEPTNHLDLPSLVWLENFLLRFSGTLLFVSHDLALLNRLSTMTLHLHQGELKPYKGNYDAFLEQQSLHDTHLEQQLKSLRQRQRHIASFVDRFRAKPTHARQVQSRVKVLEKIEVAQQEIQSSQRQETKDIIMPLRVKQKSGMRVLELDKCTIGYQQPLCKKLSLTVMRGQRIAVIGANGIGKSTLLKSLAGHLGLLEGTTQFGHNVDIAYYAQERQDQLCESATILENLAQANPELSEMQLRRFLGGFLFSGQDVYKTVRILSGGEKSRISLCCLLAQGANVLLLDEPTNHLDMASTDVLAEALSNFEGTVIFVSHNRHFINQTATHIFAMSDKGHAKLFEGQLDDYRETALREGYPCVA